jgi:hypothetical protein
MSIQVFIEERVTEVTVEETEVIVNVEGGEVEVVIGGEGSQGPAGADAPTFAWVLDLQTGNTVAARAHNDTERDAAIAACGTGEYTKIVAPPGEFYFNTTMVIDKPITLEGAGDWYYNGTTFWSPVSTAFVRIEYNGGDTPASGRGTLIERMRFGPATAAAFSADTPGILIRARCTMRNVNVTTAPGHGIAVIASTGESPATNANLVELVNCRADANKGHGFYFEGADGNAFLALICDAASNLMDGFRDASFLGGSFVGCHSEANGGRSFAIGVQDETGDVLEVNSRSRATSCYVEGGQGAVLLGPRAKWDGPYPPDAFDAASTGAYKTDQSSNYEAFVNEGVRFSAGRANQPIAFEIASTADGDNPFQMIYGVVAGASVAGAYSLLYKGTDSVFAFTDDQHETVAYRRQMWLPKGAHFGTTMGDKITGTERSAAPQPAGGIASAGSGTLVALANHVHALGVADDITTSSLAALPKYIPAGRTFTLNVASGTNAALEIEGFFGGGTLRIVGAKWNVEHGIEECGEQLDGERPSRPVGASHGGWHRVLP